MVDWVSPEEIMFERQAFVKVIHVFAGVYFWEFLTSLDFEWSFVCGKKRFSWYMVPYFSARWIALGVMIALMAVWSMDRRCVVPLTLLMLGQWGVIIWAIHGAGASWIPGEGCTRQSMSLTAQLATLLYSLGFDFIVMVLCAYKLVGPLRSHSRLMNLLFRDGLIYFVIVFLGTLPSAVLVALNLNPVMNVMVLTPSLYISLIAACRVVRRLSNFSAIDPALHPSMSTPLTEQSKIVFRPREALSNPPSDPQIKASLWSPA
ncbi:hypothetical protein NLI96_g5497 [Meripilus lineatus]|uniref:Uncharacterized protein n=1 Tax=Meripilus lineatus TaxID=2056292 RepID=A0AAD5V4M9_9APHY|nr:hypothetical protein NLI96_g5497 [Physisporinus lineatus]